MQYDIWNLPSGNRRKFWLCCILNREADCYYDYPYRYEANNIATEQYRYSPSLRSG